MTQPRWNPNIPDQEVRMRNNPGKRGVTTGKTSESAGRLLVLVNFGPNENTYKLYDQLELCGQPESIRDLMETGRFGTPDDLRRILTFQKVKGELTNILYSMESSNTDFYAYQFKPVLKFLDSPVGRLLIADEVGLGKTIESMYIWKELQAREEARRLLIVCPAMLRDKWKRDIEKRFNMNPEVVDAKNLLKTTQSFLQRGNPHSFIYVTSLEGLRVKNWKDKNAKGTRVELARLLESHPANDEFSLFDLVIIDEAHYLRNPETANHELGKLLREASGHLILLTATPIQIRSTNLYQLLKLISPEDFFDPATFEKMLEANKPVVDALRLIWRTSPDLEGTRQAVDEALKSDYFSKSSRLKQLRTELDAETITPEKQVRLGEVLENSSLFGQFMTRSRKREVMENRAQRRPQTLSVKFTPQEKQVYDYITHKIRLQARGEKGVSVFRLIARQRQMSSSMVAALSAWNNKGVLDDFLVTDDDDEELLYEIFGDELEENDLNMDRIFNSSHPKSKNIDCPFPEGKAEFEQFIEELKKADTKYQELIKFFRNEISANKEEKFVLFAFFRDTLTYLQKRLKDDGINTCLIMGGIKREEKQEVLENFKNNNTRSVLLSSEVGSEGIDLQFCRFIINYDLPWNPMRVEQRIGRLDRLGQRSATICIVHFSFKDTIEEYILEKLYERIKIFEESIGDLEDILGERTEQLIIDLLSSDLSENELKERAEANIRAIAREINQQRNLENEAMNLVAFSDYILSMINQGRDQRRWLHPDDIKAFVNDFFRLQYPGTVISPNPKQEGLFDIKLSDEAKPDLKLFCNQRRVEKGTRLHSQTVACFFDPKIAGIMGKPNHELLAPSHPLIQWIRHKYEPESQNEEGAQTFQLVSASRLKSQDVDVGSGVYVYVIHLWKLKGLRTETRLAYQVMRLSDGLILPENQAESLVNKAAFTGEQKPNAINLVDVDRVLSAYEKCEEHLQIAFTENEVAFEAENQDKCDVQEGSAKAYAKRKWQEYEQRIENLNSQGKTGLIPAIAGLIGKNTQQLNLTLKRIEQKRKITTSNPALCAGLIFMEE
ncbi:MAG: SNF2-related protein [Microcoleus sp.]